MNPPSLSTAHITDFVENMYSNLSTDADCFTANPPKTEQIIP